MSLSRVNVVFCFGHYFRYFPVFKPSLVHFILKATLLVVTVLPRRQTFPDLFYMRFYCLFFGQQFPVFPRFQTFSC